MMRRLLLCTLVFLAFTGAFAQKFLAKKAAPPPTGNLLHETFNNVTNYDDGTGANAWTTGGNGGTNDPNESAGNLFSTGTEYQEFTCTNSQSAYSYNELASLQSGDVYIEFKVYVPTLGVTTEGGGTKIFGATATASVPVSTSPLIGSLYYDIDGDVDAGCTGDCWRLQIRMGNAFSTSYPEFTAGVVHTVKIRLNNTSAVGEAWFDGVLYNTVTDTNEDVRYLWFGQIDAPSIGMSVYFENLEVDTAQYIP